MNRMKIVKTYTRHNKKTKDVDIRKIKREIRNRLENDLGFLVREEGCVGYTKEKYDLPWYWFVILEIEEHNERPIYQRITLRIEHFGEKISYPWREGQLLALIEEHGLRKVKNKEEG